MDEVMRKRRIDDDEPEMLRLKRFMFTDEENSAAMEISVQEVTVLFIAGVTPTSPELNP